LNAWEIGGIRKEQVILAGYDLKGCICTIKKEFLFYP
jgi:hypothetical protein